MWALRLRFFGAARRFTLRPRRPRAVSAGEHGVPAVRRGRGAGAGRGREPARLPGLRHHGGQALVLLQVTSLSVYLSCFFFSGARVAVFVEAARRSCCSGLWTTYVASRLEPPPPFRGARRRPRVPRTPGGRRKRLVVAWSYDGRLHAGRASRMARRWQLQLAARRPRSLPQYACFCCKLKGAPRVDREPHACY